MDKPRHNVCNHQVLLGKIENQKHLGRVTSIHHNVRAEKGAPVTEFEELKGSRVCLPKQQALQGLELILLQVKSKEERTCDKALFSEWPKR